LSPAGAPLVAGAIRLSVNGVMRQNGDIGDMIWRPAEIVAAASRLWALKPGDLIFTGTPSGVGPLQRGDAVLAEVEGLEPLRFTIS
jgi:fumarylpyruvate hydrolase